MSKKIEKCSMCGFPKEESCELMAGKDKDGVAVCCCTQLQKKSVKKQ
ncbi:TPA: hypothetical protein HA344_00975 [Candidatus Bathyarchaeota archaeon]|nr:hypothetical protein [Candidatus Bathyarchaeota archaeon]